MLHPLLFAPKILSSFTMEIHYSLRIRMWTTFTRWQVKETETKYISVTDNKEDL